MSFFSKQLHKPLHYTIAVLFFFSGLQGEESPLPVINYSLKADGRAWTIGFEDHDNDQQVIEYVTNGETVENWTEIFTLHYIYTAPVTINEFFNNFKRLLQQKMPQKVYFQILSKDKNSLLAEWWISAQSSNDQYELIRIFNQNKFIAIMRYTNKKLAEIDSKKPIWESIFQQAKLSNVKDLPQKSGLESISKPTPQNPKWRFE